MQKKLDSREQCLAMLTSLCEEQGWNLSEAQRQEYVDAVGSLLAHGEGEALVRQRLYFYHLDHEQVRSLRDAYHPEHSGAWEVWLTSALRIVRSTGLASNESALLAVEDLAQVALEELLHALPNYAYRSRFTTWAYPIIARAARRHWTMLRAAKRSGPTAPLEAALAKGEPQVGADEQPEQVADLNALMDLISTLLVEQRDERMAKIFRLWALEDQRLRDIALQVGLDPTRVSVLLKEARELLRGHQAIRAWVEEPGQDKES